MFSKLYLTTFKKIKSFNPDKKDKKIFDKVKEAFS